MSPYIKQSLLSGFYLFLSVYSVLAADVSETTSFEPKDLRGYGRVSGESIESDLGSVLKLKFESEENAELAQAKYLSDMSVLPGVPPMELSIEEGPVFALNVNGQGIVAALRQEEQVWIFAADDEAAIESLIKQAIPNGLNNWSSVSDAEVPMWLDRWDRFGFRFYYRPWSTPKGLNDAEYNYLEEFEFAENNDRAGFMFWENGNSIDTAEDMTNQVYQDWARRAARERMLPVGLNIMVGGKGQAWLKNNYRSDMQMKMPYFVGNFHKIGDGYSGANGTTSWASEGLIRKELNNLQYIIEDYVQDPNLTTILEPHGELKHGPQDIFMEYGPVADKSYQKFLTKKYGTIQTLNKRWGTHYKSMVEVAVPELASFLGWGPDAVDISGIWKLKYEPLPEGVSYTVEDNNRIYRDDIETLGAEDEWFEVDYDDSEWAELDAGDSDQAMFISHRPGVLRRQFELSADWLGQHDKVWLYLWDLNVPTHADIKVVLNGELVAEEQVSFNFPHWTAVEVRGLLKPGKNTIALRLPQSMLAYRVYLSPQAPAQYPNLGDHQNAQWVDYIDWTQWSRVDVARRSLSMIRGITPNHQITLMAPDSYADNMLLLAKDYGGNFHNTGYMGAFWADYLPTLMRGASLPFSLEPGGPAKDIEGFKKHLGLYSTEGLQGIDYFIHIGNIMWDDQIREYFEGNINAIKLIGKYHAPETELAALYSTNANAYTSFPWSPDPERLPAGYWGWNWRSYLQGVYESDAVAETSFGTGDAEKYKVIIDTNTIVMDDSTVAKIEDYVRNGGVFVTFAQTGRHTPEKPNSWPISKLTGFKVIGIDPLTEDGRNAVKPRGMKPAEGENVFHGDWSQVKANGLSLEAVAPDARPLMYWEDGTVAVGVRPLGKGYIVELGAKFDGRKMNDRLEPNDSPLPERVTDTRRLFTQLLQWQGLEPIESAWVPKNRYVLLRHFVTNNGFYDVWTVWNQHKEQATTGSIQLPQDDGATWAYDVVNEEVLPVTDGDINVSLEPLQTRVFLTPRLEIAESPARWFDLQRQWWREPVASDGEVFDLPMHPNSVDLGMDWRILPMEDGEVDIASLSKNFDDSDWGTLERFGIWSTVPEYAGVNHALLRKSFTVPAEWTEGDVALSLHSWWQSTFVTNGRIWLDGVLIKDWGREGIIDVNPEGVLTPGSEHVLAVEIKSDGVLAGSRGTAWLWIWRKPELSVDLAGAWESTVDGLNYDETLELPGAYRAMNLRRSVKIPAEYEGKQVSIDVDASGGLCGVMVNGHWVMRFHHLIGDRFVMDVTPWVKFGEKNDIELSTRTGPRSGDVRAIHMDFN